MHDEESLVLIIIVSTFKGKKNSLSSLTCIVGERIGEEHPEWGREWEWWEGAECEDRESWVSCRI